MEEAVCSICFVTQNEQEEIKEKEKENENEKQKEKHKELVQLDCTHCFHTGCLNKWLNVNVNCPLCRKDISLEMFEKLKHKNIQFNHAAAQLADSFMKLQKEHEQKEKEKVDQTNGEKEEEQGERKEEKEEKEEEGQEQLEKKTKKIKTLFTNMFASVDVIENLFESNSLPSGDLDLAQSMQSVPIFKNVDPNWWRAMLTNEKFSRACEAMKGPSETTDLTECLTYNFEAAYSDKEELKQAEHMMQEAMLDVIQQAGEPAFLSFMSAIMSATESLIVEQPEQKEQAENALIQQSLNEQPLNQEQTLIEPLAIEQPVNEEQPLIEVEASTSERAPIEIPLFLQPSHDQTRSESSASRKRKLDPDEESNKKQKTDSTL